MIMEALRWYVEGLAAFWVSLAGGGLLKLIMIGCLIYWICCRRKRWGCHRGRCRCSHHRCRCGGCGCDDVDDAADEVDGMEAKA